VYVGDDGVVGVVWVECWVVMSDISLGVYGGSAARRGVAAD